MAIAADATSFIRDLKMKLAFTSKFDARDVHKRSGTPYYMTQALEKSGVALDYICPLKTHLPPGFKFKRFLKKIVGGQHESGRSNLFTIKNYSAQVNARLKNLDVQAILAHIMDPLAYLENDIPKIVWTDAAYASLLGFYPGLSHHSAQATEEINEMTCEFFSRCSLAIFSSEWAAQDALRLYGASKEKIKVVPFGANMECNNTLDDVRNMLKLRSRKVIKLLFIGKEWWRKGGDQVLAVAKSLHESGHPVELTLVGCVPPVALPSYVKSLGYVSKRTPEGLEKISQLLRESHFLFVPSRAEAFGIVFCEANAFGLPCLTSYVGGISTIVKDNINGMTFSLDTTPEIYRDYILSVMDNYQRYEELALSSFHEYESRLNWGVAVNEVKKLITSIV